MRSKKIYNLIPPKGTNPVRVGFFFGNFYNTMRKEKPSGFSFQRNVKRMRYKYIPTLDGGRLVYSAKINNKDIKLRTSHQSKKTRAQLKAWLREEVHTCAEIQPRLTFGPDKK